MKSAKIPPEVTIFVAALSVRIFYDLAIYLTLGFPGLMTGDSFAYLGSAQRLVVALRNGSLQGWDWLGHDLSSMPLTVWIAAINVWFFGELAPLAAVIVQGAVDSATCVIVYRLALAIAPRAALAGAICSALNPTQIVIAGLLLTDTLFVFFAALSLLATVHWLQSGSWQNCVTISVALAGAAMTRVLIVFWVPLVAVLMLATVLVSRRLRAGHVLHVIVIATAVLAAVAPILARNFVRYDAIALTPQGGFHAALWIVPLVQEIRNGTPWAEGARAMAAEVRQRYPLASENPFVEAQRHTELARERLGEIGIMGIAKAWTIGAIINLGAPALSMAPPVANMPRTGFYATHGENAAAKVFNYLFRSDNVMYAWLMIIALTGLVCMRLIQASGLFELLRRLPNLAPVILLIAWSGFILAVNGPVASPKYRLPLEPLLMLLSGSALIALRDRLTRPTAPVVGRTTP